MVQQKIFNFNFSENYSFENFFVSDSNIDAYNHVLSINNSLNSYNFKRSCKIWKNSSRTSLAKKK